MISTYAMVKYGLLLMTIWKSDFSDKIKWEFFLVVAMSVLLYGCIIWTLMKCFKKKLDENYTGMQHTVLNKSWKQHFMKQLL